MKLHQIFEAKRTKVDTPPDISNLDNLFTKKQYDVTTKPRQGRVANPKNNAVSNAETKRRVSNVKMPNHNFNINFDDIDISDEINDQQAAQNTNRTNNTAGNVDIPPTPQNLPAIINKALATTSRDVANQQSVDVDWHMVKNLPGYMAAPIRAMGRQIFSPFTSTAIEDINVIANLNDSGPNDDREIDAVSRYVSSNGTPNTVATLEFQKIIPGYSADVVAYDADGYTFLLVKDFAGKYIYSWPSADNKKMAQKISRS